MEENKFFRGVWRINGIAILVLLVFVIGIGGYNLLAELIHHDKPTVITNVAQDPQGQEKWSLGRISEIDGTDYMYIPLESEKKDISAPVPALSSGLHKYSERYFEPSRNVLFVNKRTGDMAWLFKGNRQLVASVDLISGMEQYEKGRKVDAIIYQVITQDTNGDTKLDSTDKAGVALSLPDGTKYKEVIGSVERVFGTTMSTDAQELLMLYQSKGMGFASTIRLPDMTIIKTKEMPKVE